MTIPIYFSHSYRLEDQELNEKFWRLFSKANFSFFVDPPSDTTVHTHLERMMGRCSAFVAVVNQRPGMPPYFCSRFVLYEYGLSIQARRPRLLLIDNRVPRSAFEDGFPRERIHTFWHNRPEDKQEELEAKIASLQRVAATFPNRLQLPRMPIAILVPHKGWDCAYADRKTLKLIEEAAALTGYTVEVLKVPNEHNALFALALDRYEAVILDVRGTDLPEWVFAYVYGRLIPSIKLVRLLRNEVPAKVELPPLVTGLRMDEREPGVESVTYWRDTDDLIWQLTCIFHKLDEEQTVLKAGRQSEVYFRTIGCAPARVFISNANKANPLGHQLSEELRLQNIAQFQYKEPDAISPGHNWQERILAELEACNVFVALIGEGYKDSNWCSREMARARARHPDLVLLPFMVEKTDVSFMDEFQVTDLSADRDGTVDRVLKELHKRLTQLGPGANRRLRRTTLLGASRESIVDAIRHVSHAAWPELLKRIRNEGVTVTTSAGDAGPVRQRDVAEQLFADVQRADFEPDDGDNVLAGLTRALADLGPARYQATMKDIVNRVTTRAKQTNR